MNNTRLASVCPSLSPVILSVLLILSCGCQSNPTATITVDPPAQSAKHLYLLIPLDLIRIGDLRYNIVIKHGDLILALAGQNRNAFRDTMVDEVAPSHHVPPSGVILHGGHHARGYQTTIKAGDIISISLLGLLEPNVPYHKIMRVDVEGMVTIDLPAPIRAAGLTTTQFEDALRAALESEEVIPIPNADTNVQVRLHSFYTLFDSEGGFTSIEIPKPDFRIVDALADYESFDNIDTIIIMRKYP